MGLFDKIFGKNNANKSAPPLDLVVTPAPQAIPSEALKAYSKLVWIWEMSNGEGADNATRTGGRPYMSATEVWPTCGACKNPLTLMIQCNLDNLPETVADHGGGILRLFYCMHEDCVGMGGWDPFDPQHHISVLKTEGTLRTAPEGTLTFAPEYVSNLTLKDDYPHWEDRRILGIEDMPQDETIAPAQGHKLAGWPYWIQGAERPKCPKCQSIMLPFIQLDNDKNREFNFGGGTGHISQCERHKDIFAFGWACG